MFEENILNPNELTKSELGDIATEQGYKVYGNETLDAAKKFISDMIEKSEKEMLSEEEQLAFESVVDEIKLLKAVKVRNEDLTVGNMYVAKEEDLEKARQAKYFKREPKAGGGYKYYYTEAQYKKEKGGEEKKEGKPSKVPTIKFVQDTINSWSREKGIGHYLKLSDNSYKGNTEFYIEPGNYKGDIYDGMQISYDQKEGVYEVAEMMAGEKEEDIKIFLETKSLKSALNTLHRGNKQKPKKVINMSLPKK